jgi:hypothetical protein
VQDSLPDEQTLTKFHAVKDFLDWQVRLLDRFCYASNIILVAMCLAATCSQAAATQPADMDMLGLSRTGQPVTLLCRSSKYMEGLAFGRTAVLTATYSCLIAT